MYQRVVPSEDLGPGTPVVGEPVPIAGHQGRQPTGIEHRLKGPAGEEDGHSRPPLTTWPWPRRQRGRSCQDMNTNNPKGRDYNNHVFC